MGRYDDIINMEHPSSERHPRMSALDHAAQFSAFAALTGYEDIISESGRRTEERPEVDEEQLEAMGRIEKELASRPAVKGLRFLPDSRKSGGRTTAFEGRVRNIDIGTSALVLADGTSIPLQDILELEVL